MYANHGGLVSVQSLAPLIASQEPHPPVAILPRIEAHTVAIALRAMPGYVVPPPSPFSPFSPRFAGVRRSS
jgi:hypothetical protein